MASLVWSQPHSWPLASNSFKFFWVDGEYGVAGRTIPVLSIVFWIPALVCLFGLVKDKMSNYAAWGLLIAIFGFISGSNFTFVGVMSQIFSISHETYIEGFAKCPISSNLLLFQSGPLGPLSLIVLGIVLLPTKSIDKFIAILITLGGSAFPLRRISRTQWVAHITDALLLIPLSILALRILSGKELVRNNFQCFFYDGIIHIQHFIKAFISPFISGKVCLQSVLDTTLVPGGNIL